MNLPSGWHRFELGEAITSTQLGGNYIGAESNLGIPMMKMGNMGRGHFAVSAYERIDSAAQINPRDYLIPGDLILNTRNSLELVGKVALWRGELPSAVFNSNMMRLVPDPTKIASTAFLNYVLNSETKLRQIRQRATGTTSVAAIYWRDLESLPLLVPPLPEQQKIADILGTWDEALAKLDALIAAKDRRKQALMQQLLTGRRRLPGSLAPVQFIKASELFSNRSERNAQDAPILSVTQDQGVVRRDSLDRKITHDEETNGTYKVVHAGDYIISLRSFQGGLEYSDLMGAVSPAYHVIYPTQPIDREFFRHYFKSSHFIGHLAVAVIGIRDGKQISFSDFGFIKLPYPHLEDQKRIGQILSAADAELRLLRQQRAALDQQKRGLMQQLLTGRTRVTS